MYGFRGERALPSWKLANAVLFKMVNAYLEFCDQPLFIHQVNHLTVQRNVLLY